MKVDGRAGSGCLMSCFEQAHEFNANHRRSQDDCQCEAESLRALLRGAGQYAGRNGGPGAGKTAKRKREALDKAHPSRLLRRQHTFGVRGQSARFEEQGGILHLAPFHDSGDQNEQTRGSESGRDQFKMAEELFDFSLCRIVEKRLLNDFLENFANDTR